MLTGSEESDLKDWSEQSEQPGPSEPVQDETSAEMSHAAVAIATAARRRAQSRENEKARRQERETPHRHTDT